MKRILSTVLTLIVGLSLGTLATLHAERTRESVMFDKNGQAIRVGDIILPDGPNAVPIKVHGFITIYEPGTYAGYDHQVRVCPGCQWVETNPELAKVNTNKEVVPSSTLDQFANWLVPSVSAEAASSVLWGS